MSHTGTCHLGTAHVMLHSQHRLQHTLRPRTPQHQALMHLLSTHVTTAAMGATLALVVSASRRRTVPKTYSLATLHGNVAANHHMCARAVAQWIIRVIRAPLQRHQRKSQLAPTASSSPITASSSPTKAPTLVNLRYLRVAKAALAKHL